MDRQRLSRRHGLDCCSHADKRSDPQALVPGTLRVIAARMDYWRDDAYPALQPWSPRASAPGCPATPWAATITGCCDRDCRSSPTESRRQSASFGYRVFVDSAPVMEKPLAQQAGLGWIGKHTNLINRDRRLLVFPRRNLHGPALAGGSRRRPITAARCRTCMEVCPTGAIVAPYVLDARRCISYLTIENTGTHSRRLATGHRQSRLRL